MLLIPPSNLDADCPSAVAPDPERRRLLAGLGLLLGSGCGAIPLIATAARWTEPPPVPRPHPSQSRPPTLWRSQPQPETSTLNATILRYQSDLRRTGRLAANERTAWLVYDFTSRRYLASINAGVPYQSASMIKPFIALAFFNKVREGTLQYTAYHRARMEAMIQYSDNQATNYFIALLDQTSRRSGPAEAEYTLKRRQPGIFQHTRIVERIPPGGRSYRNRASALDYHRFLAALWYEQLPYAAELKRLMNLPNRDRVYSEAAGVARQTQVFDKTGTTAQLCGDMGILVARGRDGRSYPYTFIGIIEKSRSARDYGQWKDARGDVIRTVSSMAYRHLRQVHDLV